MSDRHFLWMTRGVVVIFAILVTLYSLTSGASIHKMVENAYKVTLVAAFIPLVAGLYWKRATTQGALFAIVLGLASWIFMEYNYPEGDTLWPPQLVGLLMSIVGMVAGSLLPQVIGRKLPHEPELATLHHHAASHTEHVAEHPHHHPPHGH